MSAQELLDELLALQEQGHDLSNIEVYYRNNLNSDVETISFVCEDLYDEKTNSILESIVLMEEIEEEYEDDEIAEQE
jgi:hypothetical protein